MNCYRCGEEISQPAGFICQPCLDEIGAMDKEIEDETQATVAHEKKAKGEIPLSPREAIIAMLNGEILVRNNGIEEKWNGKDFVYRYPADKSDEWLRSTNGFTPLFRKPKKNTRPMDTFECFAWVNSTESQGWLVSIKTKHDGDWRQWDIPQRFKYDGDEEYKTSFDYVSYRRARILPDKSGIDESTIQGFVIEE